MNLKAPALACGQQKTPPPEGDGVVLIVTRKEEIPCPWQAWQ
jgi:hypothetical protein